jgi:hypothetical protein
MALLSITLYVFSHIILSDKRLLARKSARPFRSRSGRDNTGFAFMIKTRLRQDVLVGTKMFKIGKTETSQYRIFCNVWVLMFCETNNYLLLTTEIAYHAYLLGMMSVLPALDFLLRKSWRQEQFSVPKALPQEPCHEILQSKEIYTHTHTYTHKYVYSRVLEFGLMPSNISNHLFI